MVGWSAGTKPPTHSVRLALALALALALGPALTRVLALNHLRPHPRLEQVIGFVVLVLGVYVLTATKDSRPGCSAGMRAVMGRYPNTPEYKALAASEVEVMEPLASCACDRVSATP